MNPNTVDLIRDAAFPAPPPGKKAWPWTKQGIQLTDKKPGRYHWPKISIVTPSYNQGQFIEETIRSVLLQGYPNLEYIIMDGGSTDGSVEIIQRYTDLLTHWESQKDNGQADAIYRGFERSTGEILGFLNSDDILLPGCLEKVGRYFVAHPKEEWIGGGAVLIGANDQPIYNRIGNPRCNLGSRVSFRSLLFWGIGFYQPASFWRRNAFFAVGGFDRSLQFCFDYDLYLRLAQRRPSGQIKALLACFRIHQASKSSTILNICRTENEILLRKYGRYQKSKRYQKAAAFWYAQRNLIRSLIIRIKLFLGLIRVPMY
jgi:glycosyltransferase involved in cell wall biosynthesis